MMGYRDFRVKQNGVVVASSSGLTAHATMEIKRYGIQYEEDGPIEIQEKVGKRWKTIYKTPQERP